MREIVFKNFTSSDNRKKSTSATEILRHQNILVESCRETRYLVKNSITNPRLLKNHLLKKPEVFISRNFDTHDKTKKFSWKIKGEMFINYDSKIFPVNYEHSFTLEVVDLVEQKRKVKKNGKKRKDK